VCYVRPVWSGPVCTFNTEISLLFPIILQLLSAGFSFMWSKIALLLAASTPFCAVGRQEWRRHANVCQLFRRLIIWRLSCSALLIVGAKGQVSITHLHVQMDIFLNRTSTEVRCKAVTVFFLFSLSSSFYLSSFYYSFHFFMTFNLFWREYVFKFASVVGGNSENWW
jgi:hypothetical protein